MSYLDSSNLEFLRRKHFGIESKLRLLKKDAAGYAIIGTLTKNFYLGRQFDTTQGAYVVKLTMDRPEDWGSQIVRDWVFVDLIKPDNTYDRYRVSTDSPPNTLEERWICNITAAFNDRTAITGVVTPDPPDPEDTAFLRVYQPYVHTQTVPATEWIINHNIGARPSVEIMDATGREVAADVLHMTINQARIYFTFPLAGSARCI